jgi:DNA polymerase-3 subunit alpha
MFLIFDTETTGLPGSWNAPLTDFANWPRVVQIAWQLHAADGKLLSAESLIVQPEGFTIPFNAEKVHGISTDRAMREGLPLTEVIERFLSDVAKCNYIAGHNIEFDLNIMGCELLRKGQQNVLTAKSSLDTKDLSTDYCALPGGRNGKFKWPTLTELHQKLFNAPFAEAHDAAYDVDATAKCFFGLISVGVIRLKELTSGAAIQYEAPQLAASNFKATNTAAPEAQAA